MFDFLNAGFWSGVGTTITIAGAIWSISSFFSGRRKRIYYQVSRFVAFPYSLPTRYEISVKVGDVISSRVFFDRVVISNRTDITLTDQDFVSPIQIRNVQEGVIYEAKVVDLADGANADIRMTESGDVILEHIQIPTGKAIGIHLSHDGSLSGTVDATLKSLPALAPRSFMDPNDRMLTMMAAIFIPMILMVVVVRMIMPDVGEADSSYMALAYLAAIFIAPVVSIMVVNLYLLRWIKRPLLWVYGMTSSEHALANQDFFSQLSDTRTTPRIPEN